ncbi:uncharacterized protein LOC129810028 [Phlebotomus papatasi]|uniref:uncharacterized protein LOC129810028 n=1 Tax=Phlebotomus papatasi TaxID=29031 RepID=UPI002483D122|nr:uncharacterized protein LOC129810028 [Phlebotomus papatasi]
MKLILGLLILISLYKDSVEGSCLSYGHSCWGAHGKRSSQRVLPRPPPHINLPTRWALLKIIPDKNIFEMRTKVQGNTADRVNDSRFFRSLSPTNTLEKPEDSESLTQTDDTSNEPQESNVNLKKLFLRDSRESEEALSNNLDNEIANSDPNDAKFFKYLDNDSAKMFV